MKSTARFVTAGAAALAATALLATPSLAATHGAQGPSTRARASGEVFVQTDGTSGNAVVVYHRHGDGTLTQAGQYATGGLGGILAGSVVDHLASQGSLTYDCRARPAVRGQRGQQHGHRRSGCTATTWSATRSSAPAARSRSAWPFAATSSTCSTPATAARCRASCGSARRWSGCRPGTARSASMRSQTPEFTSTPGQVAFTPDGRQLVVTTKGNGNDIDVFAVVPGRRPVGPPGGQRRPGRGPVRGQLRRGRSPGRIRSRDQQRGHASPSATTGSSP